MKPRGIAEADPEPVEFVESVSRKDVISFAKVFNSALVLVRFHQLRAMKFGGHSPEAGHCGDNGVGLCKEQHEHKCKFNETALHKVPASQAHKEALEMEEAKRVWDYDCHVILSKIRSIFSSWAQVEKKKRAASVPPVVQTASVDVEMEEEHD